MSDVPLRLRTPHPGAPAGLPIGASFPWLAPLAGYSDLPFRLLCRELGARVACTEMVSAKGLVFGQSKKSNAANDLLASFPPLLAPTGKGGVNAPYLAPGVSHEVVVPDTPLVVQLFGAECAFMEEAVRILAGCGYTWFDCNMGCAVPKVGKSGAGAAMLNDLDNALTVAQGMIRAAGRGRVGFKLRLGRDVGEEVYVALGRRLEEAGAGWLTLHPRYAKQKFSGVADWTAVKSLVDAVSIPVMVSGDLFTASDGVAALDVTGAAGVMFARGAMHNPAIFGQFVDMVAGGSVQLDEEKGRFVDAASLERVIRRHAVLVRSFYSVRANRQGVESGLLKMRTFVPRYVKECSGARFLRRSLAVCTTWQELGELLDDFFTHDENLVKAPQEAEGVSL